MPRAAELIAVELVDFEVVGGWEVEALVGSSRSCITALLFPRERDDHLTV